MKASGEFEVQLNPLENNSEGKDGINLGRMSIDKTFSCDLNATSKGEMLSVMIATKGSTGYVALEQVHGKLGGKEGSFVLQHYGIMGGGQDYLKLEVVPDSGAGELSGLSGKMSIEIKDGKHFYIFEYEIDR
jgi:hypothetical protein